MRNIFKTTLVLAAALAALAAKNTGTHAEHTQALAGGPIDLATGLAAFQPVRDGNRTVWEYTLKVQESQLRLVNGTLYNVFAYNGQIPGPLLVAREGDWVRIHLINETSTSHTIHSHGLFVPQRMDGVPHNHGMLPTAGMPMDPAMPKAVEAGEEFTYEYIARPSGTHWYHCHVNTNEHLARGMAGPLIILPRESEPATDHDYVFMLQEWDSKYAKEGTPGNPREMNNADFFTINGKSFPETPVISVKLGETVRFRFINAGVQAHAIHLHGNTFLVTHKDGAPLTEPMEMDTVNIAPAERIDFIVKANNPGEWPLHCHSAPHQTNAGVYPGGMMLHLKVGEESYPQTGDGPVGPGTFSLLNIWRAYSHKRLQVTQ